MWDAGPRHARLVVEDAAEVVTVREDVGLVGEVGAAGVDEVDTAVRGSSAHAWMCFRSPRGEELTADCSLAQRPAPADASSL